VKRALVLAALIACTPASGEVPRSPLPGGEMVLHPLTYSTVIHGDTRFEREERELAEYAAESWKQFSSGRVDIALKWDLDEPNLVRLRDSARMIRVSADDPRTEEVHAKHRLPSNVHVCAWTHDSDQYLPLIIGIVPKCAAELTPVFLHEFGHAAKIPDLPGRERGIMSVVYGTWRFSEADFEACKKQMLCIGAPPPGLIR
jgi:hypothetical protein